MKKTELIAAVAEQSGLSKKDAEKALSATLDTIVKAVADGDKIQLTGFGTFEQRQRNARTGVDPRISKGIALDKAQDSCQRSLRRGQGRCQRKTGACLV